MRLVSRPGVSLEKNGWADGLARAHGGMVIVAHGKSIIESSAAERN
jgi:hypothetical protein